MKTDQKREKLKKALNKDSSSSFSVSSADESKDDNIKFSRNEKVHHANTLNAAELSELSIQTAIQPENSTRKTQSSLKIKKFDQGSNPKKTVTIDDPEHYLKRSTTDS
jgi:hypothetical protein